MRKKKKTPNASCLFEVFTHTHHAARSPRAAKVADISFEKHMLADNLVLEKSEVHIKIERIIEHIFVLRKGSKKIEFGSIVIVTKIRIVGLVTTGVFYLMVITMTSWRGSVTATLDI
jgi:hypothetical protein